MDRVERIGELLVVLLVLLACGCTPDEKVSKPLEPGAVARIDSTVITADQLRSFVMRMPPSLLSHQEANQARRKYLRSLLARHLLISEARARGLDKAPEVQTKLMARWRQHIVDVYRRQAIASQVRISEEEMRTFFETNGLDRQRQFAGILVGDEELAKNIREQLDSGGDFEVLAAAHSIDSRSSSQGGKLGFVDIEQARKLQIPDEIFRSLPVGQISPVLPMGKNYQIFRFLGDRPVPFEKRRQEIRDLLYERKLIEAEAQEIRRLERKLELRLAPEGMALLQDKASLYTRVRRQQLSPQESMQPLFIYKGGQITLGEYLDFLWKDMRALSGWGVQDEAGVLDAAGTLVLGQIMLFEAAQRGGITERPEERQWLNENLEELLVTQLRQQQVVDSVLVSQEEAEDYYADHEDSFREETKYILVEVLVETEAEAAALREALGHGETLSSLAQQYTVRPGMREEAGLTHMGAYERLTQPLLYKAVRQATVGQIVGPVPVKGGFSLFKVLDRQEGELPKFIQVEARARALVRGEKRERFFEAWIDDLLDQYAARITLSAEALTSALPDTLLGRLTGENGGQQDR